MRILAFFKSCETLWETWCLTCLKHQIELVWNLKSIQEQLKTRFAFQNSKLVKTALTFKQTIGSSKLCFYHLNIINTLHMNDTSHHPWPVTPLTTNSKFTSSICRWTWVESSRPVQSVHSGQTPSIRFTGALEVLKHQLETLLRRIRSQLQEVSFWTSNSLILDLQFKNGLAVLFLHLHWSLTLNQLPVSMIIHDFNLIFRN